MPTAATFADRLNLALDQLPHGLRPPEKGRGRQLHVAKMFGVSQKGARKWLEGEALPHTSRLLKIAARCGVSGEWLLTGRGTMRADSAVSEPSASYAALPETPARRETQRLFQLIADAVDAGALSERDLAALESVVHWRIGWRAR
jgi:transcriptional regulator with XRE-family HTH domain